MHPTPLGIAFYERSVARYRALYPQIDAPLPTQEIAPDAPYVERTQKHRRCLACRGFYLAEITHTYQQHPNNTWSRGEQAIRCLNDQGQEEDACVCQEEDLSEQRCTFLALLETLEAQGWQVRCERRHTWYNDLPYLVSRRDTPDFVAPRQVLTAIAPLRGGDTDIEDYRNVALCVQ